MALLEQRRDTRVTCLSGPVSPDRPAAQSATGTATQAERSGAAAEHAEHAMTTERTTLAKVGLVAV